MAPHNRAESQFDWLLIATLFVVGVSFFACAVAGTAKWHLASVGTALFVELGGAFVTTAAFAVLTKQLIVEPAKAARSFNRGYGGPALPRVRRRWLLGSTICGAVIVAVTFIMAALKVAELWLSITLEVGVALMLVSVLAVAQLLITDLANVDATYRPLQSGDLCYQAIPPSEVWQEWLIDGGVLHCKHEPRHTYDVPLLLLPDLSLTALFFGGLKKRFRLLGLLSGRK